MDLEVGWFVPKVRQRFDRVSAVVTLFYGLVFVINALDFAVATPAPRTVSFLAPAVGVHHKDVVLNVFTIAVFTAKRAVRSGAGDEPLSDQVLSQLHQVIIYPGRGCLGSDDGDGEVVLHIFSLLRH